MTKLQTIQFRESKNRKAEQIPWEPRVVLLTSQEVALLDTIRLQLRTDITLEEIDYHELVEFALEEVRTKLRYVDREDILLSLRFHLIFKPESLNDST